MATNILNGFSESVIGTNMYSDSTLNKMKKSELIELLHIAQHNYDTLMFAYGNTVKMNIELNEKQISKN